MHPAVPSDSEQLHHTPAAQSGPTSPRKALYSVEEPHTRTAAGQRLRELLPPRDQQRLIEFVLQVSEEQQATRSRPAYLLERVEAEAMIAVNTSQPQEVHTGRMILAALAAEPAGIRVVLDNVVKFWQTGSLPPRWTA